MYKTQLLFKENSYLQHNKQSTRKSSDICHIQVQNLIIYCRKFACSTLETVNRENVDNEINRHNLWLVGFFAFSL